MAHDAEHVPASPVVQLRPLTISRVPAFDGRFFNGNSAPTAAAKDK